MYEVYEVYWLSIGETVHQTKIIRNNCHDLQTATLGIDCTGTIDTVSAGKKKPLLPRWLQILKMVLFLVHVHVSYYIYENHWYRQSKGKVIEDALFCILPYLLESYPINKANWEGNMMLKRTQCLFLYLFIHWKIVVIFFNLISKTRKYLYR